MNPLNMIEIETQWGHRSFELYHADVTRLDFAVDMLVVSAFSGSYSPTPGTVVAALLEHYGLDLRVLMANAWLDLRQGLGCWISKELQCQPVRRVLGVELLGSERGVADALSNVFVAASVAEWKGCKVRTIALPVLGAGSQMLDAGSVLNVLLPCALDYLRRSGSVTRIAFVEKDAKRAALLDRAMNAKLGRVGVVLPRAPLITGLRKEIMAALEAARRTPLEDGTLLADLRRVVESDASRSFEIGIVGRRLAERVVDAIVDEGGESDLFSKIEKAASVGVAPWIRSYLHVLRVVGNELAHERESKVRIPENIGEADLALCFFCLLRTLTFYLEWRDTEV